MSPRGKQFSKNFESLGPRNWLGQYTNVKVVDGVTLYFPYQGKADKKGVLTIGYGHVLKVGDDWMKKGITIDEVEFIHDQDIKKHTSSIDKVVKTPLNQHEFDALGLFQMNLGPEGLAKGNSGGPTSILIKLNAGKKKEAALRLYLYCNSAGHFTEGLFFRRLAETLIFLTGEYTMVSRQNYKSVIKKIAAATRPTAEAELQGFYTKKTGRK